MTTQNISTVNNKEAMASATHFGNVNNESAGYQVKRVKLDDHGFEEAGVNKGNARALENLLYEIKEGHLVDANQSEQDINKRREAIAIEISEKKSSIIEQEGNEITLREQVIPEKEQEIKEKEDEIRQLQAGKFESRAASDHDPMMMWMWGITSLLLGLYLVLFYASAIHSIFFRNLLQELMSHGNSKNITMLMNSIFDPSALFTARSSIVIIYLGSVLFFAIGLIANHYLHKNYQWWKKALIGTLVLAVPFAADFLIAFKIHTNIVEAKSMMGVEDLTPWYKSTNFYLVIVFGYLAYMAWGLVFYLFNQERSKRNPVNTANHSIQTLKAEIKSLKSELRQLGHDLSDIRNLIARLNQELESLQKKYDYILQDPDLLRHSLHQFFSGWLRYLNSGNLVHAISECSSLFEKFMESHFPSEPNILLNTMKK
jgi:peptidoglycan hydrolase CwlO-like protein